MAFTLLTAVWFVISALTGSFVWRMGIDMLFFFITTVFLVALLKIKKMILSVNKTNKFKPNVALMNWNFCLFAFESLIYLIVFILATQVSNSNGDKDTSECRVIVSFDVSYWFLWLALISRTAITSYMNVKFSQELRKTNR